MDEIKQYLVAEIKEERFAFDIKYVQEIIREVPITKVRTKCNFFEGVINVRNRVIPLINMKQKLFNEAGYAKEYVVVIVHDGNDQNQVGIMADEVASVVTLPDELIDYPMLLGTALDQKMVAGIGKLENGLLIIMNIANIFTNEEKSTIDRAVKNKKKKLEESA